MSSSTSLILYFPPKDPTERLDYWMDFTAQLTLDDDSFGQVQAVGCNAATPGLTVESPPLHSGNLAGLWASGGSNETFYLLDFTISTAGGRIYTRSGWLRVVNR